jgi:uncharacterized protein
MADEPSDRLLSGSRVSPDAGGTCPICDKATEHKFRPFCSRHCADLDLHRWLEGHYAIPAEDDENVPDDESVRH